MSVFDHPSPHLQVWAAENYESARERAWSRWIDDVEALLGHTADGDQRVDGYSLAGFYDAWKLGVTPQKAVADIGSHAAPRDDLFTGGL